jgi:hypothetical protein
LINRQGIGGWEGREARHVLKNEGDETPREGMKLG